MGGVEKVSQDNYPHLVIRSRKHSKRKKSNWSCFHIYIKVLISITSYNARTDDPRSRILCLHMKWVKYIRRCCIPMHARTHPYINSCNTLWSGQVVLLCLQAASTSAVQRSTGRTESRTPNSQGKWSWQKRGLYHIAAQVQQGVR